MRVLCSIPYIYRLFGPIPQNGQRCIHLAFILGILFINLIPKGASKPLLAVIDFVFFLVASLLYATWRKIGIALAIVTIVFIVYAFLGITPRRSCATGVGDYFTSLATAAFGRFRGGPAKVAVIASALFGSISGSSIANVIGTGTFTIPMMKKTKFEPEFAGAVEAAASTGGQIMPPIMGAAAFLVAEILQKSY